MAGTPRALLEKSSGAFLFSRDRVCATSLLDAISSVV
jgi:hypothetical protein